MKQKKNRDPKKHISAYLNDEESVKLEELRTRLHNHGVLPSRSDLLRMGLLLLYQEKVEKVEEVGA